MNARFEKLLFELARTIAEPLSISCSLICFSQLECSASPIGVRSGSTPVQQFKNFLASPPNIEQVAWRKLSITDQTNEQRVADWPGANYVSQSFFAARWQPNCLFLRSASNAIDALVIDNRVGDTLGRKGNSFWSRTPKGLTTIWQDTMLSPTQIRHGPPLAFHNRARDIFDVLNMGIMYVEPGSVKWEENQFSATGYVPELKLEVSISGTLKCDANQLVKQSDVQYTSRIAIWKYVLKYSYGTNNVPPFLPDRIEVFFQSDTGSRKFAELQVLSMKTSARPLENGLFELNLASWTNSSQILYFTNDTWYAKNAFGELSPVVPGAINLPNMQKLNKHDYYFGAVAVNTLFAAVLLLKARQKHTSSKKG
jgi:hypothetical protein